MYDLMAVVVHCGSGPNRGHYISIVKSHGFWVLFDDDIVDVSITEKHLYVNNLNNIILFVYLAFQCQTEDINCSCSLSNNITQIRLPYITASYYL